VRLNGRSGRRTVSPIRTIPWVTPSPVSSSPSLITQQANRGTGEPARPARGGPARGRPARLIRRAFAHTVNICSTLLVGTLLGDGRMSPAASAGASGVIDLALAGASVVVTGAGSGIGAATARLLGAAGASVALVGRRAELLEQTAAAVGKAGGRAL